MKRFLIIIGTSLLCLVLGGCTLFPSALHEMARLAVVQALGVDRAGAELRLSLVTAADSSRGEGPVRLSGRGSTIQSAAEDAAARAAEEELFCAHTGYVLLGEESARQDAADLLRYVCRSREIRMDVPLLIVRGASAEEALLQSGGERVGAAELLDALSAAAPTQLGFALPSVARIAGRLAGGGCALAAAISCERAAEQDQEGGEERTLACAGLAVLQDGKLRAFLSQEEAVGVDLLCGAQGVHSFVVTDREGRCVTLQSAPGKTDLRVLGGEDEQTLELTIRVPAAVVEIDGEGKLSDSDYADELAALLERELLRRAGAVLRRQQELGADFLALRERAGLDGGEPPRVRLSASVRIAHSNDVRDG